MEKWKIEARKKMLENIEQSKGMEGQAIEFMLKYGITDKESYRQLGKRNIKIDEVLAVAVRKQIRKNKKQSKKEN